MPAQAHKIENSRHLAQFVDEYELGIIEQIEDIYGDEMTVTQAWYIGKLIGMFGPNRVKKALKEHSNKNDPVRYAYSMLVRNQLGKGRQHDETKEIDYKVIGEDDKIW